MGRPKGSKNKKKKVEEVKPEVVEVRTDAKVIEGWVNLYCKGGYYTGADIYKTKEAAKARAFANVIGQFFISCEVST